MPISRCVRVATKGGGVRCCDSSRGLQAIVTHPLSQEVATAHLLSTAQLRLPAVVQLQLQVCIMGGSYGGYATLAGLTFTPELYKCGVDLVGISNVATFMKSIPPYWKPLRYEWITRVGDAENNATLNREISPYYHVNSMQAPLLIGQGANDPRVPQPESDQMFDAMKANGLPVEYVLYSGAWWCSVVEVKGLMVDCTPLRTAQ